jgi:hypothetical protein
MKKLSSGLPSPRVDLVRKPRTGSKGSEEKEAVDGKWEELKSPGYFGVPVVED